MTFVKILKVIGLSSGSLYAGLGSIARAGLGSIARAGLGSIARAGLGLIASTHRESCVVDNPKPNPKSQPCLALEWSSVQIRSLMLLLGLPGHIMTRHDKA